MKRRDVIPIAWVGFLIEGSNYEVRGFLTTEPLILLSLEYIAYQPKVIPVCGLNVGASAILILG